MGEAKRRRGRPPKSAFPKRPGRQPDGRPPNNDQVLVDIADNATAVFGLDQRRARDFVLLLAEGRLRFWIAARTPEEAEAFRAKIGASCRVVPRAEVPAGLRDGVPGSVVMTGSLPATVKARARALSRLKPRPPPAKPSRTK